MLTDQQSEPRNEEAGRVLKFFMSTLLNGSMKAPQPVHQMRSLTTVRLPQSCLPCLQHRSLPPGDLRRANTQRNPVYHFNGLSST
jgi:hypothetical protein